MFGLVQFMLIGRKKLYLCRFLVFLTFSEIFLYLMFQLIDNYVDVQPDLSPLDKLWQNTVSTITEEAMLLTTSIHNLSNKVPLLHANACLQLGVFMNLLTRYNNSGWFDPWTLKVTTNLSIMFIYSVFLKLICVCSYLNFSTFYNGVLS